MARVDGAPADQAEQDLVRSTMQQFDADANEGSRLLLSGAGADAPQADDVRQWAAEQSARLEGMRASMPAQDKADSPARMLDQLLGEAEAVAQTPLRPGPRGVPAVVGDAPGRRRGDRARARRRRAERGTADGHARR